MKRVRGDPIGDSTEVIDSGGDSTEVTDAGEELAGEVVGEELVFAVSPDIPEDKPLYLVQSN